MTFIVLDGPDGAGKTTQIGLLAEHLTASGRSVLLVREPGGTPVGEEIRQVLLTGDDRKIGRRAELLLYMASRAQLVEQVIVPALDEGKVVLSDRFILASVVYQGLAGGLPPATVETVGQIAVNGLEPDLTIVLDIDAATAAERQDHLPDRIEARGAAYHQKVREGFLALAEQMINVRVLDGRQTVEALQQEIRRLADEACE